MRIAFASGKGGTGKTTIAVNYAYYMAKSGRRIQFLDCDVEEPNGHIFLKPKDNKKKIVNVMVPVVDLEKCTFCGKCGEQCRFKAIVNLKNNVMIFNEMCHSCGLCAKTCPEKAIREEEREVGYLEAGKALNGINFIRGVLNVSEPMAGPVISAVKKYYNGEDIAIFDAPPGTSCPVVKTIADADIVVLVTEPTPFGLHDLKIAASVVSGMNKPSGVVINREDEEYTPLKDFLSEKNIPVLMNLPEDREIAEIYADGEIIINVLPHYRDHFKNLDDNIRKLLLAEKSKEA